MLGWVKVVVGLLIMATFVLPLITVGTYRRLRSEPMAVLVANMSAYDLLFGVLLALVGLLELSLEPVPAGACSALQYLVVAAAGAVKTAALGLAVDQFTAVTSPLRYPILMEGRLRWLLAAAALVMVQVAAQGAAFHAAGAPSWAQLVAAAAADDTEIDADGSFSYNNTFINDTFINDTFIGNRTGYTNFSIEVGTEPSGGGAEDGTPGSSGEVEFPGCRWEKAVSNTYILLFEAQLFTTSVATSALFVYTALSGYRQSRQIRHRRHGMETSPENDRFFANFAVFRTLLKLMALSLLLDVTTPVFRLYQRWHPMPRLAGVLHVLRLGGTILEGSTYGMMNRSLRQGYRKLLGLSTTTVNPTNPIKPAAATTNDPGTRGHAGA